MGRCATTVLVAVMAAGCAEGMLTNVRTPVSPTADSAARIRTDNADIRALIAEGLRRSSVFRRLVETIAATDGIVYVLRQSCGPRGVRSCLSMSMTIAGDRRMVFVRLTPRRYDDVAIASLGHELQHAIEVFSDPTVTSGGEMHFLFKRIGSWVNGASFETPAAVREGDAILAELRRAAGH